jgi:hypothetical protein
MPGLGFFYFCLVLDEEVSSVLLCKREIERESIRYCIVWLRDAFVLGSNYMAAISFNSGS